LPPSWSLFANKTTPFGSRISNLPILFSSCFFLNLDRIHETDFSKTVSIALSAIFSNINLAAGIKTWFVRAVAPMPIAIETNSCG
jgi:hypothetical protein